jgi:hypothetical protein
MKCVKSYKNNASSALNLLDKTHSNYIDIALKHGINMFPIYVPRSIHPANPRKKIGALCKTAIIPNLLTITDDIIEYSYRIAVTADGTILPILDEFRKEYSVNETILYTDLPYTMRNNWLYYYNLHKLSKNTGILIRYRHADK